MKIIAMPRSKLFFKSLASRPYQNLGYSISGYKLSQVSTIDILVQEPGSSKSLNNFRVVV